MLKLKKNIKIFLHFFAYNLELIIWILAIIYLFFVNPSHQHYTLCPLSNLGYEYCPGCGLGRACASALHGHFVLSLETHPLGIFALLVIGHRIFTLIKNIFHYKNFNTTNYEHRTQVFTRSTRT